jgi:hypothetical protein
MSDITHPRAAWRLTGGYERRVLRTSQKIPAGGARRDRTDDLLLAKQALSQLSYGPSRYPGISSQSSGKEERARLNINSRLLIPEGGGPGKI